MHREGQKNLPEDVFLAREHHFPATIAALAAHWPHHIRDENGQKRAIFTEKAPQRVTRPEPADKKAEPKWTSVPLFYS